MSVHFPQSHAEKTPLALAALLLVCLVHRPVDAADGPPSFVVIMADEK